MEPSVLQTYSTTALAPLLEALLTRLGPAESSPVQQRPIADDLRLWVGQLRRQSAPTNLEAWQALGVGEYLTVVGEQAGLSARWAGQDVDCITVQQPDRRWTFEFFACEPGQPPLPSLRVTLSSDVQVISQTAFAADATYQDERDWKAQIAEAISHLKEALQKGDLPDSLPGSLPPASLTPPATGMESAQVVPQLGAAALAAATIVGSVLKETAPPEPVKPDLRCGKCHTGLGVGAKFCTYCGAVSLTTCAKCGSSLRPSAKYCIRCGTPV